MTSPRTLTSGPPELPGLMAASVWMKSWMLPWPRPGRPLSARPLALTMPRGDREGEPFAERIADGQHPLADAGVVAVAERHRRQRLGVDLEDRDVGVGIGADDLGLELPPVEQPDRDLLGALDHVVVGQDVAVGRDDEARAAALLDLGLLAEARGEEPLHARRDALLLAGVLGPLGADVDHARLHVLGHGGEGLAQLLQRAGRRDRRRRHRGDGRGLAPLLLGRGAARQVEQARRTAAPARTPGPPGHRT